MKKTALAALVLLLLCFCFAALAEHQHTWKLRWNYDAHWYECSDCGEKRDEETHYVMCDST